VAQHLNSKV